MNFPLWNHIRDWFILGILLVTSMLFMLTSNQPVMRGMRLLSLESTTWLEVSYEWIRRYSHALEENETLRRRNILLSEQVAQSTEALLENERLRRLIAFRDTTAYELIPTRIVNKDFTGQWNYLTLDAGSEEGIAPPMPVINEHGILGHVILVSKRYARVMPYLNTAMRIPAKIQPAQTFGVVRWEGMRTDQLRLNHVVKTDPVEVGHVAVTAGYSDIFPPGLPIGTIDSVAVESGKNELIVFVRPAASLSTAEHAFVIGKSPDPERLALEDQPIR